MYSFTFDGNSTFRKPLSCHLFPIRLGNFGGDYLSYQAFTTCDPALTKGKSEKTFLVDMLREPLIRLYGEAWYQSLIIHLQSINPSFTLQEVAQ